MNDAGNLTPKRGWILPAIIAAFAVSAPALAQSPRFEADVPASVTTPDTVETESLGTLSFFDGAPDEATVAKVYDNLDFLRGVDAFLNGIPAASIHGLCKGFEEAGVGPFKIGIFEDLMDARSLFLTANSTTVMSSLASTSRTGRW